MVNRQFEMTDLPHAELSSLATALEEISRRITVLAESWDGGQLDDMARELYEVERSLGEGLRRLARITASPA